MGSVLLPLLNVLLYITGLLLLSRFTFLLHWPGMGVAMVWPDTRLALSAIIALLLGPLLFFLQQVRKKSDRCSCGPAGIVASILAPAAYLPLALLPAFLVPFLPPGLASNILVYLPVFLLSLVLYRLLNHWLRNQKRQPAGRHLVLVTGVLLTLAFWLIGWFFGNTAGEHLGDEGHYLIQARSLYQDHDLDLLNNFNSLELQRLHGPNGRQRMHISAFTRPGHYYSWHSYGIALLLAPAVPYGTAGLHLVLGILAGLGGAGLLLLCLVLGADRRVSLIFTLLFCFSSLWGIYACRALPETVGATLLIWLFAGLLLQERYPWRSLFLTAGCAIALPWMHTRFVPLSVLGGCFFLWSVFRDHRHPRTRWQRALVFTCISAAGGLLFLYLNSLMFDSSSGYPIKSTLFSYVPGMWKIFINWRSVTYMVPMVALLLAATCWYGIHGTRERFPAIMALTFLLSVAATSCTYSGWGGGSSAVGRYVLVVVPLLLPFGALYYHRAGRVTRWMFLFTGLISCAFYLLLLWNLPLLQRYFTDPRADLAYLLPLFSGLSNPFNSPHDLYGMVFYLIAFLLVFFRQQATGMQLGLVFLLALVTYVSHDPEWVFKKRALNTREKVVNISKMKHISIEKGLVSVRSRDSERYQPDDIFINRLNFYVPETIGTITTDILDPPVQGNLISQPRLAANDWQGRGYRWANLINAFSADAGDKLLCLEGKREGTSDFVLAVAELSASGSHTALEKEVQADARGRIRQCFSMQTLGVGDIYVLGRFAGNDGTIWFDAISWYPVGAKFVRQSGLQTPYPLQERGN